MKISKKAKRLKAAMDKLVTGMQLEILRMLTHYGKDN